MRMKGKALAAVATLGLGAAGGLGIWSASQPPSAEAADHLDPPMRTDPTGNPSADRAADIADVYAWHQGTGATATMVVIMTFAGPNAPAADQAVPCDPNVLYGIHIDNDGNPGAEFDIQARFGEDDVGNCFVRVAGIPGAQGQTIDGPVERPINRLGVRVFAGLRDDPFFFDLTGFRETVMTGTLAFVEDRDFFQGQNTSALVVELPLSAVSPGGEQLQVWGTTGRAP